MRAPWPDELGMHGGAGTDPLALPQAMWPLPVQHACVKALFDALAPIDMAVARSA